ncbi:MAG: magnesium transporter [Dehalococcoidia bacterium]|nr:magnesium transporter [Dehalococcoidia bacterium]
MENLDEKTFHELIDARNLTALRERLMTLDALDVAILLDTASEDEMAIAFRLLPKALAVEVFDDFDGPTQHRLLESMANRTAGQLLEAMSPDDRTELLEEVPASVARRLMGLLSPEQRQVTLQLLGYEENSAGREMTPYFVDLRSNMTVAQAMERIRTLAMDRETIYECYVIDPRRRLEGTVSLKELVLARPDMTVADVTQPNPRKVFTHSDREEAASILRENRLLAVPVVDSEERLVGIITQDDVADIMEEEVTEDIYRFGAVQGTERGYFTTRVFNVVRRRISWLLLLLVVNTATASIIAGHEQLLAEVVLLAAFIPLLIGTGGNIGAQSATVVIRGLATGEIRPRRAFSIIGREVTVGLLLGVALGGAVLAWSFWLGRDSDVSLVVALTLVVVATLATAVGSALPFLFRLSRVDPALVSAPLVTTVMDISGVGVYFGVARILLSL